MTEKQADRLIDAIEELTAELRRHRVSPSPAPAPAPSWWSAYPQPIWRVPLPADPWHHPTVWCADSTPQITQEQAKALFGAVREVAESGALARRDRSVTTPTRESDD